MNQSFPDLEATQAAPPEEMNDFRKKIKTFVNNIQCDKVNWIDYWEIISFRRLMMVGMFVETWIHGFQIILNITKVNEYFVMILNLGIVLPMKYMKLNVQQIKKISQCYVFL